MRASTSQGLRRFPVFAAAAAGVLGGHWLTYALILAEPARRDAVLSATGHGYLRIASVTALVLVVLALGSAVICALDARSDPAGAPRAARIRRLFPRLWLMQGVAFAGMEVGERLAAGAPLDVLLGRVLVLGLIVQALVAAVAALLLLVLHRAAAGIARLMGFSGTAFAPRVLPSLAAPCLNGSRSPILAGAAGLRGPPLI